MALEINDDFIALEIDGAILATATRRADDWWEVTCWPRFFRRDDAITALMVTELLETGHTNDDPLVIALREELR